MPTLDVGDGVRGAEIVELVSAVTDGDGEKTNDDDAAGESDIIWASVTVDVVLKDSDTVPEEDTDDESEEEVVTVPESSDVNVLDTEDEALGDSAPEGDGKNDDVKPRDDKPEGAGDSDDAMLRDVRCVPSMVYNGDADEASDVLGEMED